MPGGLLVTRGVCPPPLKSNTDEWGDVIIRLQSALVVVNELRNSESVAGEITSISNDLGSAGEGTPPSGDIPARLERLAAAIRLDCDLKSAAQYIEAVVKSITGTPPGPPVLTVVDGTNQNTTPGP